MHAIIIITACKKTILIASETYVMCVIDAIPDAILGFLKIIFSKSLSSQLALLALFWLS